MGRWLFRAIRQPAFLPGAGAEFLAMDRRSAMVFLAATTLGACGGGGGGATGLAAAPPPPPSAPAPATGLSSSIAAWGDSLTVPFAANLQVVNYPDRVVFNGGVVGE